MALLAALVLLAPPSPMAIAQSLSRESSQAVVAKNIGYFEKHLAADYAFTTAKGQKQTKSAALGGMKGAFSSIKGAPKVVAKVVSARMDGAGIVYVEDQTITAKVGGGPKYTTIKSRTRTENACAKQGAVWVFKRTKALKDVTIVNGKTMPSN